jgi:hypothetical protein
LETCEVTFDETQPRSQLVFECAGVDELGEEIFRRRSMNLEMMKMAVWCPRLNTYILLRLQWLTAPLEHLRQRIMIEEKLQLRGR